ncbi:MAG: hypothetical protein M1825_005444 [Sarcosagium campestre]|nr:MAG: hypothetical protein M1825_005444 [Sarcosagium campestre]
MPKRRRGEDESDATPQRPPKLTRKTLNIDRISALSDELLLRVLSNLSPFTLIRCQNVSGRFRRLATDSQLWKAAYYDRFVRPRASRIPGIKAQPALSSSLFYSSSTSKWLDDDVLVKRGPETDWKGQYKLRHNWARGSCGISEIEVAEQAQAPPLLVRLYDGILITADATYGLRAWSMKGQQSLIASILFTNGALGLEDHRVPTALAVDSREFTDADIIDVVVGYEDGGLTLFQFDSNNAEFTCKHTHTSSSNGTITAVALSSPHLLTITDAQRLTLYTLERSTADLDTDNERYTLRLISSLRSHTVWPPLSLSIRSASQNIVASIAYAMPTYLSGWTVGIQEVRLTTDGGNPESRLASAVQQGFTSISLSSASLKPTPPTSPPSFRGSAESPQSRSRAKPTSLSYTHPYLLASHPDNTLTLYLVTSTATELSISGGDRLWGHTSSVSGAHISSKGKAVSVSTRGDELRLWELEGGFLSAAYRRKLAMGESSVEIRPDKMKSGDADTGSKIDVAGDDCHLPGFATGQVQRAPVSVDSVTKGWVGFDEESVVVLRERDQGRQSLVIYDFT